MEAEHLSPIERLLAESRVPLIVGTTGGIIVACNAAALDLLRAPATTVVGSLLTQFDVGRSIDRVAEMHEKLTAGAAARSTTVYRRADGSYVVVDGHVSPCLWRGAPHVLGIVVPVAEVDFHGADAVDAFASQGGVVVQCAWCRRIYEHPGRWVARTLPPLNRIPVSHGICPECYSRISVLDASAGEAAPAGQGP